MGGGNPFLHELLAGTSTGIHPRRLPPRPFHPNGHIVPRRAQASSPVLVHGRATMLHAQQVKHAL